MPGEWNEQENFCLYRECDMVFSHEESAWDFHKSDIMFLQFP